MQSSHRGDHQNITKGSTQTIRCGILSQEIWDTAHPMQTLRYDVLGASLPHEFKLIKAPVLNVQIINLLSNQPQLLPAIFEINGRTYQVMIDTGATISTIPEHSEILKVAQVKIKRANVLVELAGRSKEHLNKKCKLHIRPSGSTITSVQAIFYIYPNKGDIFGH